MDLHQLRIFATVFQNLSFTKASEKLRISQPTISEHIKNLENEFGYRLFDRLGRRIAPTPRAREIHPKVCALLDHAERLRDECVAADGVLRGELVVGASTIPGTYILPVKSGAFAEKHPEVSFEIRIGDTMEITEKVLDHSLYCAVVGAKRKNSALSYTPVARDELVFVAGAACAGRLPAPLGPGDLCRCPLLLREQGSGTRDSMLALLEKAGVRLDDLRVVATLGSSAAIKEAVKSGMGISCLSRLAVADALARGELVELPVAGLSMERDFFLVSLARRTMPGRYRAFCAYLCGEESP